MNKYQEMVVTGTQYQRACRVMVELAEGKDVAVTFVEEIVTDASGDRKKKLVGSLPCKLTATEAEHLKGVLDALYAKHADIRDKTPKTPDAPMQSPEEMMGKSEVRNV